MVESNVKPRLTKQERAFVEAFDQKIWIARNKDDSLFAFENKPVKLKCIWLINGFGSEMILKDEIFKFITWESEKAWNSEELLALEVEEDTPMKPIEKYVVDGSYYVCSKCGTLFDEAHLIKKHHCLIEDVNYCKCCGEKIDWSVLDE